MCRFDQKTFIDAETVPFMPIDRFTFENGRNRAFLIVKKSVYEFLFLNKDYAYTIGELYNILNLNKQKEEDIDYTLRRLEVNGLIKQYNGSKEETTGPPYYKFVSFPKPVTGFAEAQKSHAYYVIANFLYYFPLTRFRARKIIADWDKYLEANLEGSLNDLVREEGILSNEVCEEQLCHIYYAYNTSRNSSEK